MAMNYNLIAQKLIFHIINMSHEPSVSLSVAHSLPLVGTEVI